MLRRHLAVILAALTLLVFLTVEGRRAYVAWRLGRGDFARLEHCDGGAYFIPAVRASERHRLQSEQCPQALAEWASRRLEAQFPDERVFDVGLFTPRELLLLLRRRPEAQAIEDRAQDARLVALDLSDEGRIVLESAPFDLNTWGFSFGRFKGLVDPVVLVHGGGTGECGLLFRREGSRFVVIPCNESRETDPYFTCWTGLELVDVDGDGIPEVRGCEGKGRDCPACGRDVEANLVTWKLDGARYRRWKIKGDVCGPSCERPWTY